MKEGSKFPPPKDARLLELIRQLTAVLENMDLKDANRKSILKIKMGLQSVVQDDSSHSKIITT